MKTRHLTPEEWDAKFEANRAKRAAEEAAKTARKNNRRRPSSEDDRLLGEDFTSKYDNNWD
jgi:hypothetical protein